MKSNFKRCYEDHPPLDLGNGQVIYGGSCGYPVVEDADVYVGLDMSIKKSDKAYPWEPGESFLFYIQDMGVPSNPAAFKKLITWLSSEVSAGRKVHVGCIGGHGRTGMVLAALVKEHMGKDDAITYVRNNYCKKAVESQAQVDFLERHFGITPVAPAKEGHYTPPKNTRAPKLHRGPSMKLVKGGAGTGTVAGARDLYDDLDDVEMTKPAKSNRSIWGPIDKSPKSDKL